MGDSGLTHRLAQRESAVGPAPARRRKQERWVTMDDRHQARSSWNIAGDRGTKRSLAALAIADEAGAAEFPRPWMSRTSNAHGFAHAQAAVIHQAADRYGSEVRGGRPAARWTSERDSTMGRTVARRCALPRTRPGVNLTQCRKEGEATNTWPLSSGGGVMFVLRGERGSTGEYGYRREWEGSTGNARGVCRSSGSTPFWWAGG